MKPWIDKHLSPLSPCEEAMEWAETYGSLEAAWAACDRGDWLLWYAARCIVSDADRKRLVLAACACARLALPYCQPGETRPLRAIETAEAWARGEGGVTLQDVATTAVSYNAYAATAAYAAAATTAAAYNAYAAAAYAAAATYAASYAATYAAAASYAAATLKRCAEIVREYYPTPPTREDGERC